MGVKATAATATTSGTNRDVSVLATGKQIQWVEKAPTGRKMEPTYFQEHNQLCNDALKDCDIDKEIVEKKNMGIDDDNMKFGRKKRHQAKSSIGP